MLADITRRAAQMPDPHRVFAMQQFGLVAFAVAFFMTAPKVTAAFGPFSAFLYNAALGALALLSLVWLPSTSASVADAAPSGGGKSSLAVGMMFVAITLSFAAQASVWTNVAVVARDSGLQLETLSRILAVGALLNVLAPLAAGHIGLRWGRTVPLLLGYVGLALSILLIALPLGPSCFAAGAMSLNLFLLFLGPFLLGTLAGLDASGRRAAAGPAFFTIGSAMGPAVGGLVVGTAGFAMLGAVGAVAAGCALTLALVAGSSIPASSRVPAQP